LISDPDFRTEMSVRFDGQVVARETLGVGEFDVRTDLPKGAQLARVELVFSHSQTLPSPDGRRAAALLQFVGFPPRLPTELKEIPADLRAPGLVYRGVYEDGWVSQTACFKLSRANRHAVLVLRGMVPLIADPNFHTEVFVRVDGAAAGRQVVGLGDFQVRVSAPSSNRVSWVEVSFSRTQRLPNGDGRAAACLLRGVGFPALELSNGGTR
jgi:hypothetical protein